jgi:hypothetical protein
MQIELSTLLTFLQLDLHFQFIAPPSLCQSLQHLWICVGSLSHFWICVTSIMWFICEPHTISLNCNASLKLREQHAKFCVSRNVKTWNNSKPFFGTLQVTWHSTPKLRLVVQNENWLCNVKNCEWEPITKLREWRTLNKTY